MKQMTGKWKWSKKSQSLIWKWKRRKVAKGWLDDLHDVW